MRLLDNDLFAFLWCMQRNSEASCIRIHAHYHQLGGGTPTSGENCWNISSEGNCEFSFLEFANFLSRCWDLLLTKLFLTKLSLTKLSFLLLTKLSLPNCHLPNCHLPNCYLPNLPYQKSARHANSKVRKSNYHLRSPSSPPLNFLAMP